MGQDWVHWNCIKCRPLIQIKKLTWQYFDSVGLQINWHAHICKTILSFMYFLTFLRIRVCNYFDLAVCHWWTTSGGGLFSISSDQHPNSKTSWKNRLAKLPSHFFICSNRAAAKTAVQTGLHHKFGPTWSWGRIAAQYVCLPRFWFWSPPQLLLEKPPRCLLRLFISSKGGAGCPGAPEWTRDIGWEFWDLKGWPQISAISRCSLRSSTCWWPEVNFCCCIELLRMLLIGSAFQLLPNRGVGFWTLLLHHRFASRCRHHVSC